MNLIRALLVTATLGLPALATPASAWAASAAAAPPTTVRIVGYTDFCDGGVSVGLANPAPVGHPPITFKVNDTALKVWPQSTVWHVIAGPNPTRKQDVAKRGVNVRIADVSAIDMTTAEGAGAKPGDRFTHRWAPPTNCGPGSAHTPTVDRIVWETCAAARAAGVTPIKEGDVGYSTALDADKDGIACEDHEATPPADAGTAAGAGTSAAAAAARPADNKSGGLANSLPSLPVTGPGTITLAIAGVLILLGAGILLIRRLTHRHHGIDFRA